MSRSSNDLKTLVAAMPLAGCQRLLDLMCIQQGTGLSEESARQRVLTAVMGRPARQRSVWLDFFVTALEAYARYHIDNWDEFSVDDLDVSVMDDEDYWDDVHTEILDQYLGNIRGVTSQLLPKFLPFNLLADLEYESDGDPVTFKLSALFVWPNASQLQSVVGDGAWIAGGSRAGSGAGSDGSVSDSDRIDQVEAAVGEWQEQLANLPETVKESLRGDISENKFGVSGENTVAILRKTLAFKVDPHKFYLFDYQLDDRGGRKVICDAENPLTKDVLAGMFFDSVMSVNDAKKIERRNLCDEKVFISARVLSTAKKLNLGDEKSKLYRDYDILRVRQQTLVKNSQPLLKTINFASRALQPLASILEQHEDEDSSVDLPRNVLESLQEVQSYLYSCLHATSDALHLVGMDGSELERQRDDMYLEGATGNKAMRVQRPNSDPVRMEKDTSALDKLADDERRRQKELASARRPRSPGPAHAPRGTSPAGGSTLRPGSLERRAAQSTADKARARTGGSPTAGAPAPAPAPGAAKVGKNAKKKK